jgi:hypothetical protein
MDKIYYNYDLQTGEYSDTKESKEFWIDYLRTMQLENILHSLQQHQKEDYDSIIELKEMSPFEYLEYELRENKC